ncbi:MAG: sodium:proton antiporter [Desulfosalsimonas sp.]|uniref:cation:proton antiporter n=1 Tax=Desulfosalsimonas sp. TaxID=3073848 RepID=UPI00397085A1
MAGVTLLLFLGVLAQWLAWRLQLPSIMLLLVFGLLAGPVTGLMDPDALFGDMLPVFVSLGVAVILFEGGINLRLEELKYTGDVVRNLITAGVLVTWVGGSILAFMFLDLPLMLSVLLGAIIVVSGPTVIGPLLRHVRLPHNTDATLEWESILIDPIGALLAVLVFEVIVTTSSPAAGTTIFLLGMIRMIIAGAVLGLAGAYFLIRMIRRFWIPDFLQNPFSLALVITVFTLSNYIAEESGLLAVTVMGIVLGNQRSVALRDIIEFKEDLRVLIISLLFIILTARLRISDLTVIDPGAVIFIVLLIVLVRPAAVMLSAMGSRLHLREKLFIAFMAPRGIVAAAVSSIFALRLSQSGYPMADKLVPLTFFVIIVTVFFYSALAAPMARILKIAEPRPSGFLIVGAHLLARKIGIALHDAGCRILLVDNQRANIKAARMAGLPCRYTNVFTDSIRLCGIGRLLALSPNDELNALAVLHYRKIFDHMEVFQLPPDVEEVHAEEVLPGHLRGRYLFDKRASFSYLYGRMLGTGIVKTVKLTENFKYEDFSRYYDNTDIPLFVIDSKGLVTPVTLDASVSLSPGHTLIALVAAKDNEQSPATVSRPQQPDYECKSPS